MAADSRRVAARYFAALCDKLARDGVDTAQLLRRSGISAEALGRQGATLTATQLQAFVSTSRELVGRTDLGFQTGLLIKLNSHDLLGYAMLSCRNVEQMLQLVSRHFHTMIDMFTVRYRRLGAVGEVVYSPVTSMPAEVLHFCLEAIAVAHHGQVAMLLGPALTGYDLLLTMPRPVHGALYDGLAPARVFFDAPGPAGVTVRMEGAMLDHHLPLDSPAVVQQIEEMLHTVRQRPLPDRDWGAFIRMLLRESRGHRLTLDEIATRIDVSTRTIDRHLLKENLQFRTLAQEVFLERARRLLAEPGATVEEVAHALGFAEAAGFTRAFRKATGVSPAAYRRAPPQRSAGRADMRAEASEAGRRTSR
ncbi:MULTISPECIES: AraC family transcriptional regulator [Ramlibacter]|uniref:Helix-turn-helix domain-containing protein n=1 Tax=Ramlibacter pinisoli TaxID=2682844 RepID=A0A6N8IV98_9BURK|nr:MULTISPECIES: AraC family transcriptional regulator [Ramlibacter]MBA2960928.1 AraC family transcriptional regulator ligand-binding domain-containing protein [Ramlibacter sp. CGMCC 1.13660]MVQ30874.1 helix-turn-helix domain-containing protein [Ramlibacter pinisoli]